jgi:hypothetical protein
VNENSRSIKCLKWLKNNECMDKNCPKCKLFSIRKYVNQENLLMISHNVNNFNYICKNCFEKDKILPMWVCFKCQYSICPNCWTKFKTAEGEDEKQQQCRITVGDKRIFKVFSPHPVIEKQQKIENESGFANFSTVLTNLLCCS